MVWLLPPLKNCIINFFICIGDFHKEKIKIYYERTVLLEDYQRTHLITEPALGSREDIILISGQTLLTNVMWYRTLVDLAEGTNDYDIEQSNKYKAEAEEVKKAINDTFWGDDGGRSYYCDRIDKNGKVQGSFDSMANFWAIISGVADQDKAKKILNFFNEKVKVFGNRAGKSPIAFAPCVDKPYHPEQIERAARRLGYWTSGEHNIFWPEITMAYAAALKKANFEEADEALGWMENLLKKHKTFYELHHKDGSPVRSHVFGFPYNAPPDFAMALSTYLWVKKNWETL